MLFLKLFLVFMVKAWDFATQGVQTFKVKEIAVTIRS